MSYPGARGYRPLTDWEFIRRFLRTHADIDNTNMRERNRRAHGGT